MGTFDLHGLILCVAQGGLTWLLCIHNVGIETFSLHGLTLCVSEGFLSELLCSHSENIDVFLPLYWKRIED